MGIEDLKTLSKQEQIKLLLEALECPMYIIGGAVRDALLSKEIKELDLTCPLAPESMITKLESKGLKTVPTGLKHQTVTVVINDQNIEITSFRSSGMNPEGGLKLGKSIEEDLSYRDFTINAIAYDVNDDRIIDPFQGKRDLALKKLCCVGNPTERFQEDPLRVMRLLRFYSQLDFEIDNTTHIAAKSFSKDVANCSIERIREEFNKLLIGINSESALTKMQELGIMDFFIPEFSACFGFEQNKFHAKDVFFHTLEVVNSTRPDLTLRLGAFFHDIGKPPSLSTDEQGERHFYKHEKIGAELTKVIMTRLKYSNKLIEEVSCLVDTHMRPIDAGKPGLRRLLRDTADIFPLWRELKEADSLAVKIDPVVLKNNLEKFDQEIAEIKSAPDVSPLANLALKGNDLIEMGMSPSPIFGVILRALHEKVLDQPELNDKEILKKLALELASGLANQ